MRKLSQIRNGVVGGVLLVVAFGLYQFNTISTTATTLETQQASVSAMSITGDWMATLEAGSIKLQLLLHVAKDGDAFHATLDSPDQGQVGLAIDKIVATETTLRFEMNALGAFYEGKFSNTGSEIVGAWNQQGQSIPLTFKRAGQARSAESPLKLQTVDVGGHHLNFLIGGKGAPAVILEGGFGIGIASWSPIQSTIATFAQTVSYDRAGLGQSEPGPEPRSAKQIATELHLALQKIGIGPPYVLVGHSLGGVFVRVFVDLYPKEVAGIVLIDPSQEAFNDWTRTHEPSEQRKMEAQIATASAGQRAEGAALKTSYAQASAARIPAGIPVTLMSATEDEGRTVEARKIWIEKHEEWLAKVPGGKHVIVQQTGHFIQLQQPALVIDAIKQVLSQAHK
jgi:pimeloyl-ACP methyl ester carboxylesterase